MTSYYLSNHYGTLFSQTWKSMYKKFVKDIPTYVVLCLGHVRKKNAWFMTILIHCQILTWKTLKNMREMTQTTFCLPWPNNNATCRSLKKRVCCNIPSLIITFTLQSVRHTGSVMANCFFFELALRDRNMQVRFFGRCF